MVNLELSDQDAARYKLFCQHYDTFTALAEGGFFNIRHGGVTVLFNREGVLVSIRKMDFSKGEELYRRKKKY